MTTKKLKGILTDVTAFITFTIFFGMFIQSIVQWMCVA